MTSSAANRVLSGLSCEHPRMSECHPGCGHWHCPDCGLLWDDGCDFPQYDPPLDELTPRESERRRRAA
jgi:hypothetical protein